MERRMTCTYILAIPTVTVCSTHSQPCMGHAARCLASLALHPTCERSHPAVLSIHVAHWPLVPVAPFYLSYARSCSIILDKSPHAISTILDLMQNLLPNLL